MRILALDIGEKNIGVAISDELGITAQGLPNLQRGQDAQTILGLSEIVKKNNVQEIVAGMPVNMDGTLGKQAREIAVFLEKIKEKIALPIKVWDERLSSLQAERIMLEADLSRKKRKKNIDRLAAQLILQSYLDAIK
ncbi:MAG: Holliday junction resolvase RuvX [Candidatus Omnitrophota bacterium]